MSAAKTRPSAADVAAALASATPAQHADAQQLIALFERVCGAPPVLWGRKIIGFGSYHYRYASGHEGDAPLIGFALGMTEFSLYLSGCDADRPALLARLGKHRAGKACVYVKRLTDVDMAVLEALAAHTVADLRKRYGA